ncbi:hypothetical protein FQA39_LY15034 [Lamprigera yunnana]|nr:hypothetical protein FQA39_LY15034 [Lamprigera yunnana]
MEISDWSKVLERIKSKKAMSKKQREEVERGIFRQEKKVIRSPEQKKREERTKDGDRNQNDKKKRKPRDGGDKRPDQRDDENDE